jgi:hypothetical protein
VRVTQIQQTLPVDIIFVYCMPKLLGQLTLLAFMQVYHLKDNSRIDIVGAGLAGNTSRNNVPNKRLLVGTFLCAVLGTLRSTLCVPDTVLDVPDIIWNISPNNIRHIFLVILLLPGVCIEIEIDLNPLNAGN